VNAPHARRGKIFSKEASRFWTQVILSSRSFELLITQLKKSFFVQEIFMTTLNRFMKDESGATAIEYALIAAFIGVAITAAVTALGDKIKERFTDIKDNLK